MQLSRPIWINRSQFSLKPYKAGIGLNVSPGSKTQELKRVCWGAGKAAMHAAGADGVFTVSHQSDANAFCSYHPWLLRFKNILAPNRLSGEGSFPFIT